MPLKGKAKAAPFGIQNALGTVFPIRFTTGLTALLHSIT